MAYLAQIKTAQGYLPFSDASLKVPGSAPADGSGMPANPFDGAFSFALLSSQELARREGEGLSDALQPGRGCNLVSLGACMERATVPLADVERAWRGLPEGRYLESSWRPSIEALLEFAKMSGPLFGHDAGFEAVRDWGYAADVAMLATRVQECVNGNKGFKSLDGLSSTIYTSDGAVVRVDPRLVKARLTKVGADVGDAFDICSVVIAPTGLYRESFGRLPFVQRVGPCPSGYLYAFAQWMPLTEEEQAASGPDARPSTVSFTVVRLPHEISAGEFRFLGGVLALSPELEKMAMVELGIGAEELEADAAGWADPMPGAPDEAGSGLLSMVDDYTYLEMPITESDSDMLSALVRTMIVAHLGGARIDPFQNSEVTGNHSFDTLLSWLWYDFSASLSRVAVGYCKQCGRPFSLVGHRGIKREFCSQKCKTDAKNERTKFNRDAARRLFIENPDLTVAQIAHEVYEKDTAEACGHVRKDLSTWVELKKGLEDELAHGGLSDSGLFKRCMAAGLDAKALLYSKRWNEMETAVRQAFPQRTTAAGIAREILGDESEGSLRLVRECLETWPVLKAALKKDIERNGRGESQMLKRCRDMGLDEHRLLGAKR